jgi:hypothetical protein
VELPRIVNGRIDRPGDVDTFGIEGKAGDTIVADLVARRLHSPLDSLVRVIDAEGNVVAWNDDHVDKTGHLHRDMGVLTHHADSYVCAELPADGAYFVQVADAQGHGGEAYAYRLRVSPPRPDFALYVAPSSINVPAGRAAEVTAHVLRTDGFDGPVDLALADAPAGFRLDGARIPAGASSVRFTITAPARRIAEPFAIGLEGRAAGGSRAITRAAQPADDVMQAFLWRHLVPTQRLMVAVVGAGRARKPVTVAGRSLVQIPAGGSATVRITGPIPPPDRKLDLNLVDPPPGIAFGNIKRGLGWLAFDLCADANAPPGLADNAIVEAFTEVQFKARNDPKTTRTRRIRLGVLPAIGFQVVTE